MVQVLQLVHLVLSATQVPLLPHFEQSPVHMETQEPVELQVWQLLASHVLPPQVPLLPLLVQILQPVHLVLSATHSPEPLHFVQPVHLETHEPPLQVWHFWASHCSPQLPQLDLSFVRSTHAEEQSEVPVLQEKVQVFAEHLPTLFGTVVVHSESEQQLGRALSMQVPEQMRLSLGHFPSQAAF
jgi:hypothetical protein